MASGQWPQYLSLVRIEDLVGPAWFVASSPSPSETLAHPSPRHVVKLVSIDEASGLLRLESPA